MKTIAIPRKGGGRPRSAKLDEIERALTQLPAGQALPLSVPTGQADNYYRNAIRTALAGRGLDVATSIVAPRRVAIWLKNSDVHVSD